MKIRILRCFAFLCCGATRKHFYSRNVLWVNVVYNIPKSILTNCTRLYFIVLHYSIEAVFMLTKVVNFLDFRA